MAKYRCPKCQEVFEGPADSCPHCGVIFKQTAKTNETQKQKSYCPNCGREIDEGTNFCPNCGNAIKQQANQGEIKGINSGDSNSLGILGFIFGLAALVLSTLSFFVFGFGAFIALVLAVFGVFFCAKTIKKGGLSTAGLVVGIISLITSLIGSIVFIFTLAAIKLVS